MHSTLLSSVAFRLYSVFPHYLIKSTIFGKVLFNIKYVSIFYANFGLNISRFKNNSMRYYHQFTYSYIKIVVIIFGYYWIFSVFDRFSKNQNIPHLITILSEICPTQNLTLVFTIQSLPYFRAKWILVTPFTYFFRIYSSIILQSQNVLRALPHSGLPSRILNGHVNSDICIYVAQMAHISASLVLPPTNYTVHIFWCCSFCHFREFFIISANLIPVISSGTSKSVSSLPWQSSST